MQMLEIGFIVLSVAFLLLIIFSIPLIVQIWRAAKNMAEALESLNHSLPGILKNMEEIMAKINGAASTLNREMESVSALGRKIRALLSFTENAELIFRRGVQLPFLETLRTARCLLKGLRVFFHVLHTNKPDQE